MKILIVQNRFFPAIGGSELHTFLLAKYLAKKGHSVTIFTTNSLSSEDVLSITIRPPFLTKQKNKPQLSQEEKIEGFTVKRFDMKLRFWGFNWVPALSREMDKVAKDYDIIHVHGYHTSTSITGCRFASKHKIPVILTDHIRIVTSALPREVRPFMGLYDRFFGKYMLTKCTRLIGVTEDNIQQYVERGGDLRKIRVIPNGIELNRFRELKIEQDTLRRYGIDGSDIVILGVGRLEKHKGVQDVIAIMPAILRDFPGAKLVIAGKDYGYESTLKKMATELGLTDRIKFTGEISDNDIMQLYKRANIFAFPSQMEGFGIVALEAMASDTLCIAYSIPAVSKLIQDRENGVLVKTKEEFLQAILYYLNHPAEKAQIEKNAAEFVNKYDMKNVIQSVEQVYQEAIDENMPGR